MRGRKKMRINKYFGKLFKLDMGRLLSLWNIGQWTPQKTGLHTPEVF